MTDICGADVPWSFVAGPGAPPSLSDLARRHAEAKVALDAAIFNHRYAGRSLRDIATDAGLTPAGVLYILRKAEGE